MEIYLFNKRIYKEKDLSEMTEEQAEREYLDDIVGAVLRYTNIHQFATDFNNGCIKPGEFFMKNY